MKSLRYIIIAVIISSGISDGLGQIPDTVKVIKNKRYKYKIIEPEHYFKIDTITSGDITKITIYDSHTHPIYIKRIIAGNTEDELTFEYTQKKHKIKTAIRKAYDKNNKEKFEGKFKYYYNITGENNILQTQRAYVGESHIKEVFKNTRKKYNKSKLKKEITIIKNFPENERKKIITTYT